MDDPLKHAKWKKSYTKDHILHNFFFVCFVSNTQTHSTERRLLVQGLEGWEVNANRYGISFWGDKNILEFDNCDNYTTLWICYTHWIVCFKRVYILVCELYFSLKILQLLEPLLKKSVRIQLWGFVNNQSLKHETILKLTQ